jgi:uncharacterized membrane protein YesL
MRVSPMADELASPDNPSEERVTDHPRHALGFLLGQWLRQGYDELGTALLLGFYLFFVGSVAFLPAVGMLALLPSGELSLFQFGWFHLPLVVVGGWLSLAAWLSLNCHLDQVLTFQYPTWRTFWAAYPRCLVRSLWTALLLGGGFGVLAFDMVMFPRMLSGIPYAGLAAVSVALWLALFLGMVQVHLIPFLVHQDRPFLTALKRATLVAVWKPLRTLFILVIEMLFAYTCFRIPPLFLMLPGLYSILSLLSLLILLDEWRDPYEKTPEAIRAGA